MVEPKKLTKSDFLDYHACAKSLWLKHHKPDAVPWPAPGAFDRMLMRDGYAVEAQVKLLVESWPDPDQLMFQKIQPLSCGTGWVEIVGGAEEVARSDPNNLREHPLQQLHKSGISYYPSRGTGPPHAAENVREDGSWEIRMGRNRPHVVISFQASEKTPTGFRFLERLQFVEPADPRCKPTLAPKG